MKPAYDNMSFDSNGLIIIEADGKFGWLNEKYELLAGRMFDKYQDSDDDGSISDMIWETIAVEADGLWGILRRDGSWLAEPQFDTIDNLDSEFIRASVANHWGFIDRNGEWTVDPIFDQIKPFSNRRYGPCENVCAQTQGCKMGYGQSFQVIGLSTRSSMTLSLLSTVWRERKSLTNGAISTLMATGPYPLLTIKQKISSMKSP